MNTHPTSAQRRFYPPRFSLQVVMIYMTLFCFCCGMGRIFLYEDVASNVSCQEANDRFRRAWSIVRVPKEATHINLYARYRGGGAEFDISENDFRAWCNERGWPLIEERSVPPNPPLYVKIGPDDVRHCYQFSNGTHRGGWTVMYDIDRQRAWLHLSPR